MCEKLLKISNCPTYFTQQLVSFFTETNHSVPLKGKFNGGETSDYTQLRFMASFYYLNTFLCHSFLISSKHAVVPAHLVMNFFMNEYPPEFSEYSLILHGGLPTCTKTSYDIVQVERHPSFNITRSNAARDIAVLTVDHLWRDLRKGL